MGLEELYRQHRARSASWATAATYRHPRAFHPPRRRRLHPLRPAPCAGLRTAWQVVEHPGRGRCGRREAASRRWPRPRPSDVDPGSSCRRATSMDSSTVRGELARSGSRWRALAIILNKRRRTAVFGALHLPVSRKLEIFLVLQRVEVAPEREQEGDVDGVSHQVASNVTALPSRAAPHAGRREASRHANEVRMGCTDLPRVEARQDDPSHPQCEGLSCRASARGKSVQPIRTSFA